MRSEKRDYFDQQVEWVLERLPEKVLALLEEIPLHVEDQPTPRLMEEMGVEQPDELCGCFTGVAIDEIYQHHPTLPNSVTLFRRGIFELARNERGVIEKEELRHQIRVTILHELAHYHGMDEDEIEEIGYG